MSNNRKTKHRSNFVMLYNLWFVLSFTETEKLVEIIDFERGGRDELALFNDQKPSMVKKRQW